MVRKSVRWRKMGEVIQCVGGSQRSILTLSSGSWVFLPVSSAIWYSCSLYAAGDSLTDGAPADPWGSLTLARLGGNEPGLREAVKLNEKSLEIQTEWRPRPFGKQRDLAECGVFTIFHINDACEAYSSALGSWVLTHCVLMGTWQDLLWVVMPHGQKPHL